MKKTAQKLFFLHFALFYTLYDNAETRISHSPLPNLSSVNKTRKVSYPEISRHYYPPPPTTGTREAQMELSGTIWNAAPRHTLTLKCVNFVNFVNFL